MQKSDISSLPLSKLEIQVTIAKSDRNLMPPIVMCTCTVLCTVTCLTMVTDHDNNGHQAMSNVVQINTSSQHWRANTAELLTSLLPPEARYIGAQAVTSHDQSHTELRPDTGEF